MHVFKTDPYRHQLEGWIQSRDREAFGLLMDPGTGKSKVTIDTFAYLEEAGRITGLLIIAPKGMYHQWIAGDGNELDKHCPDAVAPRVRRYLWNGLGSAREQRLAEAMLVRNNLVPVVVMNVEAVNSDKALRYAQAFLKAHRALMVVDESTTIKNVAAKRTKRIIALGGLAEYRRILTGTPVTNSPLDVYGQMSFLDGKILGGSWYAFRARYATMEKQRIGGGREINIITGYQRLDELQARIAPFVFRAVKAECTDMPPKIYQRYHVEMGAEQARAYQSMKESALICINESSVVTAPLVLTQLGRLRQVLCGFTQPDEGAPLHEFKDSKRLATLLELIEGIPDKAIIWCGYRHNVAEVAAALRKVYGNDSVVTYVGGETSDTRREKQDAFNSDPALRFFVGTPQTGKFGLNLRVANTVIFYSNDFDLEVRLQAEDRSDRIGRTTPVTIIDLVVPGTLDERILKLLLERKKIAGLVTGDTWRGWL